MHSSRLTRIGHLLVTLLAVFAFSALTAAAAQATEVGPFWSVKGTRLGAGETRNVVAKAVTKQTLTAGSDKVICEEVEAKPGVILGTAEGEAGKNGETLRYSKCKVEGNGSACKVEKEEISTNSLKSELVEDAATKKILLVDFLPATGKTFAEIKFEGTCSIKSTKVTGVDVLAEVLTDPGELTIELGGTSRGSAKSWRLKIEEPQPTGFWLIKGGVGSEVKIGSEEKLEAFGAKAELKGTALIELESGEEWSPLA